MKITNNGAFIFLAIWLTIFGASEIARSQTNITGSVQRPFPSLMPADYSWCRAAAWIEALFNARRNIPKAVALRLEALRLDSPLGQLALCALACPLRLVTPESSSDSEIRVYLASPGEDGFSLALDNPEKLVVEMGLISDLAKRVNYLARHWPRSLVDARERDRKIDEQFSELDDLWNILHPSVDEGLKRLKDDEAGELAEKLGDSVVLWALAAEARERADLPQGALIAADNALKYSDPASAQAVWMNSEIYYIRALAHWKMAQPALAETDLETAARLLEREGIKGAPLARLYAKLGDFYFLRNNFEDMCGAYERACASGDCVRLAEALREGKCGFEVRGEESDS